ncbi:MAG TPA: hypothetical protein VH540_00620 [Ktedonobacterales bacterium]
MVSHQVRAACSSADPGGTSPPGMLVVQGEAVLVDNRLFGGDEQLRRAKDGGAPAAGTARTCWR